MQTEINTIDDFRRWAKAQMAYRELTHRELARSMQIAYPRISEALHGKPSGQKYIRPLILALGGDLADFEKVLPLEEPNNRPQKERP